MGKGLRIVHLNIRSLLKNFDELFVLFDDYDIILLSETWLNNTVDSKLINRHGFTLYRQDRDNKIKKKGGGLAIYVKDEIALYVSNISQVCDVTRNLEQMWVRVEEPGHRYYVIGVMYRPPMGSIKSFMEEVKNSMNIVFNENKMKEHVIMGDFNIDFQHSEISKCKNLRNLMEEYNLQHYPTAHTRVTQRSRTTIDLIFSDMQHIVEVGVRQVSISDHLPTFLIKKKKRNCIKYEIREVRNMSLYDIVNLEYIIRNDNRWIEYWIENRTVDELWDIMYVILIDAVDAVCPKIMKRSQIDRPSWVTKEVKERLKEKNRLYMKVKVNGNETGLNLGKKKDQPRNLLQRVKVV